MTRQRLLMGILVVVALCLASTATHALMLPQKLNLISLIRESNSIMLGNVQNVTDGIDENGLPYTEITMGIEEQFRGESPEGTYTFRQIGLLSPRLSPDGTRRMPAAPEGMPKYAVGDHILLFLNPKASMTGFQTPVALGTGKFRIDSGQAENDYANDGVFSNVSLAPGLATDNDRRILETTAGAVNPDALLSLVRRAVQNHWVETCNMWNTDEGPVNCPGNIVKRPIHAPQPKTVTTTKTPTAAPTVSFK